MEEVSHDLTIGLPTYLNDNSNVRLRKPRSDRNFVVKSESSYRKSDVLAPQRQGVQNVKKT